MALSSGFFDSVNGDRTYSAEDFGSVFDGLITDGVYTSFDQFGIGWDTNGIIVKSGRAWFNHIWVQNDADVHLTFPTQTTQKQDGYVCIRVNKNDSVRASSLVIVTAVYGSNSGTQFNNGSSGIWDYVIGKFEVPVIGGTSWGTNMQNLVGVSHPAVPAANRAMFVANILENLDVTTLTEGMQARYDEWFATLPQEFTLPLGTASGGTGSTSIGRGMNTEAQGATPTGLYGNLGAGSASTLTLNPSKEVVRNLLQSLPTTTTALADGDIFGIMKSNVAYQKTALDVVKMTNDRGIYIAPQASGPISSSAGRILVRENGNTYSRSYGDLATYMTSVMPPSGPTTMLLTPSIFGSNNGPNDPEIGLPPQIIARRQQIPEAYTTLIEVLPFKITIYYPPAPFKPSNSFYYVDGYYTTMDNAYTTIRIDSLPNNTGSTVAAPTTYIDARLEQPTLVGATLLDYDPSNGFWVGAFTTPYPTHTFDSGGEIQVGGWSFMTNAQY